MVSYSAYKLIHLFGGFLLITSLGAICGLSLATAESAGTASMARLRKLAGMGHGIALLLILVGGFGALARLELGGLPGWIYLKLAVWLLLGATPIVLRRKPDSSRLMMVVIPVLAAAAAFLAIFHPGG